MGRTYAGILGPLAFSVVMARGLFDGGSLATILWTATWTLFGFAAIGCAVGNIASATIRDSVQQQMNEELAAIQEREVETGIGEHSGV